MIDPGLIATIAGLLGLSVADLLPPLSARRKKRRQINDQAEAATRIEKLNRIAAEGFLTKALSRYYTADNLQTGNLLRYVYSTDGVRRDSTMVYKPEWMNLAIALDRGEHCSIVPATPAPNKISKARVANLIQQIEQQRIRIWDAPIYRLMDVDFRQDTLRASFAVDEFLRYRFTIGLLQDELIEGLINAEFDLDKMFHPNYRDFPLRDETLPNGKSIIDFDRRMCAGGISTCFAMARPHPFNDFAIPVQKRSSSVSDSQGLLSPIPRAFHQPMVDPSSELKLSFTVFRELYEELFGGTETEENVKRLQADWWLHQSKPIQWFHEHKGAYTFECICLGIDLLSGNYHFGILLAVRDESFWRDFGHQLMTNWEVADSGGKLVSSKNYNQVAEYTHRVDWTEDVFIFVEALKYLQALEPNRCNIPKLELLTHHNS
jgi:hypothetical protein